MREDNHWTQKNIAIATLIEADRSTLLYRQIGERISAMRLKNGLTQEDLGQLVSINRHRVFDIENGRLTARIDAVLIHAIAVALGVPIFELLPQTELVLDLANKKQQVIIEEQETLTFYNEHEYFMFRAQLAQNIHNRRREKNLSPTELSALLGGNKNLTRLIAKIETGKAIADIFLLLAIAYGLNTPLDNLLPSFKIDRIQCFIKGINNQDVITLHKLFDLKPDILKITLSNRVKELYDENAVTRSLFYANN